MTDESPKSATWALLDGHVHIHDCHSVAALLDSAGRNFREYAGNLHLPWPCLMVLMLTETAAADRFGELRAATLEIGGGDGLPIGGWRLTASEENASLRACNDAGEMIYLVAGRQVVTLEGLEVLALATAARFPDGEPMETCLDRVQRSGAITVVPWGFGKWTGARGRIVRRLIEEDRDPPIHLGDNSARLRLWPPPAEFALAATKGIHVLPGTDPLPFPGEEARVGRHGFALRAPISGNRPAADLRSLLSDPEIRPVPFGRGEGLIRFVRNQVAMQILKRRRSGSVGEPDGPKA